MFILKKTVFKYFAIFTGKQLSCQYREILRTPNLKNTYVRLYLRYDRHTEPQYPERKNAITHLLGCNCNLEKTKLIVNFKISQNLVFL